MQLHKKIAIGVLGFAGAMTAVFANTPSSIISPTSLENIFPGISNRESPIRYIRGGNEFNGMFLWRDEEFLVTPEVVTDGTTTYSCRARLKGVYYNNQRGNRRWPLDAETKTLLANSDSSYNNITISGGLFTFCDGMPSRNTVGQITHTNVNGGPTYKLVGGGFNPNLNNNTYSFATLSQQNNGAFLTSGSLKGYWKNAFGFIYDSAGGLGEVCGGRGYNRYSQNGGTGENRTGYAIVNRCVGDGSGQGLTEGITTPDSSSGNVLSGGTILSGSVTSGQLISGSVISPGNGIFVSAGGFLVVTKTNRIRNVAAWNGVLLAPIQTGNAGTGATGLQHLVQAPFRTFKAGASVGLEFVQGYAMLSLPTDKPAETLLSLYRSEDGLTWTPNSPDTQCVVQVDGNCTFNTNHLTYFALVEEVDPEIEEKSSNPRRKLDVCKTGDYSKSKYDKKCFDKDTVVEVKKPRSASIIDSAKTKREVLQYEYVREDVPFVVFVPSVSDARIGKLLTAIHEAMLAKIFPRVDSKVKLEKLLPVYQTLLMDIAKTYDLKTMGKKAFGASVSSFAKVLGEIKK